MSAAPKPAAGEKAVEKKGGKKKLLIPLVVVLLAGAGAGGWFSGIIPKALGKEGGSEHADGGHGGEHGGAHGSPPAAAHGGAHGSEGGGEHGEKKAEGKGSNFMDLPDIVANLNTGGRRASFVKVKVKLELARAEDQALLAAAMPRVLDLYQGYLREMRPEEMRGTAATYRLREELLARTNLAAPPARVVAVLFTEIIVQ